MYVSLVTSPHSGRLCYGVRVVGVFFLCHCKMPVVRHWLALDFLESFVELDCCSFCASHPFILPFIYLLLHIKRKCLILKGLLTEGKKGHLLTVAAAFLCQVISSVFLIYKGKLGETAWNGGVESKN